MHAHACTETRATIEVRSGFWAKRFRLPSALSSIEDLPYTAAAVYLYLYLYLCSISLKEDVSRSP